MKMILLPQIIYLCIVYSVGSNQKDDNGRGTWEITSIVMEKDDDAMDIVQKTFLRLYQKENMFQKGKDFKTGF